MNDLRDESPKRKVETDAQTARTHNPNATGREFGANMAQNIRNAAGCKEGPGDANPEGEEIRLLHKIMENWGNPSTPLPMMIDWLRLYRGTRPHLPYSEVMIATLRLDLAKEVQNSQLYRDQADGYRTQLINANRKMEGLVGPPITITLYLGNIIDLVTSEKVHSAIAEALSKVPNLYRATIKTGKPPEGEPCVVKTMDTVTKAFNAFSQALGAPQFSSGDQPQNTDYRDLYHEKVRELQSMTMERHHLNRRLERLGEDYGNLSKAFDALKCDAAEAVQKWKLVTEERNSWHTRHDMVCVERNGYLKQLKDIKNYTTNV